MLTEDLKKRIDDSVLCWLATADVDGLPNVSPKEVFTYYGNEWLLIANIASPGSVKNIQANPKVCVSFIHILIQKGYQVKGVATIVKKSEPEFALLAEPLLAITKGKYPFVSLTKIKIEQVKPIIAPSYLLFPETTEASQIQSALSTYAIKPE